MSLINDFVLFSKIMVKDFLKNPGSKNVYYGLKYFSAWRRHHGPGKNSVDDRMPWMSFAAIDLLKKIIRPEMQVFEYGSGGSTLFWSGHVKSVVSVEHDRLWFERMQQELARQHIGNVEYLLREAEDDIDFPTKNFRDPNDLISSDEHYTGKNFRGYVTVIDKYPDMSFDAIVVDGRARPSCIKHALPKLKKDGYLIVDNSERKYYLAPFNFDKKDWEVLTFGGPVPYIEHFSDTTILHKK